MRIKIFLAVILICSASAGAITVELTSGMLPYTFGTVQGGSHTTWDTLKVDRAGSESVKLTTTGTGISVGVSRVCIDLSGPDEVPGNADDDTLWWGTDSTQTNLRAVVFNSNASAVVESCLTIRGGYYIHAPDNWYGQEYRVWRASDAVNVGHIAFSLGGIFTHTVKIDSVARVDIRGYRNYTITMNNSTRILMSRIFCLTAGFGSRSDFAAGAIWANRIDTAYITPGVNAGDTNWYNWKIENSYIYSNSQNCIYFGHNNLATVGIPSAAGTYTGNWSIYGAATAWEAVRTADSSITYIYYSGGTSISESFNLPSFTAYADKRVVSVTVSLQARYTTASGAIVRPFIRYGGLITYGANYTLPANWTTYTSEMLARPDGGDWWSLFGSNLTDLEVGVQYVSGGSSVAQISRCVATVDFDDDDGILQMAYDTLVGDVRNHADMQYEDGYYSTTNSYIVWIQSMAGWSRIHHCQVLSGDEYKGNRGFHLYTINDTLGYDDYILQIDSNYANIHDGFSTQYGDVSHTAVMKLRAGASRIKMFGNEFILVCDTFNVANSDGWLYAGDTVPYFWGGSVITLQNNTFNDPSIDRPWRVEIYNNIFRANLRSDNTTHGYSSVSIYTVDNQFEEDTTYKVYGNQCYYYDTYIGYGWPGFDGPGAYTLFYNDTLHYINTILSMDSTIVNDDMGADGDHNILRDIYWAEGGYSNIESDVFFPDADDEDVLWQRTLRLYVIDSLDQPVNGAAVWAVNAYGDTVIDTTTNASGLAYGVVNYNYQVAVGPDSTGYNPLDIKAALSGDTAQAYMTVDYSVFSDTLALQVGAEEPTPTTVIKFNGGKIGRIRK